MKQRTALIAGFAGGVLGGAVALNIGRDRSRSPEMPIDPPTPVVSVVQPPADPHEVARAQRITELSREAEGLTGVEVFIRALGLLIAVIVRSIWGLFSLSLRVLKRDRSVAKTSQNEPARPMGVVGLALLTLLAWLAVSSFQAHDVRDIATAWGLILVALGTLLVTPQLLTAKSLKRLDDRWLHSPMPAVQIALARVARKILRWTVATASWISAASLLVTGSVILLVRYASLPHGLRHGVVDLGVAGVYVSFFAVTALIVGFALSKMAGKPTSLPAEPVTATEFAKLLSLPEVKDQLLRGAVLMVLVGTLVQIFATVFFRA